MLKMIHCDEASELLSKGMEVDLGFWEKMNLKFHVVMCGKCRTFGQQIKTLRKVFKSREFENPNLVLTPEQKKAMQEQIDKEL